MDTMCCYAKTFQNHLAHKMYGYCRETNMIPKPLYELYIRILKYGFRVISVDRCSDMSIKNFGYAITLTSTAYSPTNYSHRMVLMPAGEEINEETAMIYRGDFEIE